MKRILSAVTSAVAAVLLAAGGAVVGASAASAAAPEVKPNRPVYLALGDSLAAGQQSFPPTGTFESTVRQWKARGFVAQFHETLRDELDCRDDTPSGRERAGCPRLQVVNLSRTGIPGGPGGVTTTTVLAEGDQLDRAVAIITERNTNASPRDDVEVVSLTVGGNDIFAPAIGACVLSPDPATTCVPALQATFLPVGMRLNQILAELRAAAGPDVLIMTTTYYNPLPFCDLGASDPARATALGDWILEGGTLPGPLAALGPLDQGFNDVVRAVSAQHGAVVADTYGTVGAGDFVGGSDCTHPNASGHAKIADVFAAALPE